MINGNGNGLLIFDNFQSLHPSTDRISYISSSGSSTSTLSSTMYNVANQIVQFQAVHPEDLYVFQSQLELDSRPSKINKHQILNKFKKSLKECNFNIFRYFSQLKDKTISIQYVEDESKKDFETLLEQASRNHQTALVDKLTKEQTRIQREFKMLKIGIKTYISEPDIIKLSRNAPRAIRLDWIKHFVRIIPVEFQSIIDGTFKECIFDNYVILHYDPKSKGSELTEAEKEKAKDPILFGVIKESRRLYYLGDWIDEYCDLTLDKLLDIINETHKTRKLTNIILTENIEE